MTHGPTEITIILAIYFAAALVKGVTGLGFSTFCLPFLTLAVGLKDALPLIVLPSIAGNIAVMVEAGAFAATVRRFWPMLAATVPGIVAGLWVLDRIAGDTAAIVLGVVLIAYCGIALTNRGPALAARLERPLQPLAGALTGFVNGVTGTQVMPMLPFLMALELPRNVFVQAINCSFTLSSAVMALGLTTLGLMTVGAAGLSVLGILFVFAGIKAGAAIGRRLSARAFRVAVLGVLMVISVVLIARGVV